MDHVSRYFWAGILLASLIAPSTQAGGLYLYELGTPDVGTAAAGWAARAQDAATVFTNPAGMTRLEKSELLVGVQPLYLNAEFSPDSNTTSSGSDGDASTWLPAGGLFYVHNLMPKLKIGVSAVGYFGLGLEYENDWVGRYYVQEIKLQAVGVQPALAYQVTEWLSLGAGVVALYGVLEEKAAVNNIDPNQSDGKLKIEDSDLDLPGKLGDFGGAAQGYALRPDISFGGRSGIQRRTRFQQSRPRIGSHPAGPRAARLRNQDRVYHASGSYVQCLSRSQRPLGNYGQPGLAGMVGVRQGGCRRDF